MFIMDDGRLPEVKSIKEFLSLAVERGYIEEDVVRSLHLGVVGAELVQPENAFKKPKNVGAGLVPARNVGVELAQLENTFKEPKNVGAELVQPENIQPVYNTPDLSINFRTPDTVLYLTKEGSDIRLNWTGSGTLYDCSISRDVKFQQGVQTLFLDLNNTTYL